MLKKIRKINFKNIFYYLQGNIRYKLYYSRFKCFLNEHILEQIDLRIDLMDDECYSNGTCKMCGCGTTELQMCDKACDKPCYLKMMTREQWNLFNTYIVDFYRGDLFIIGKAVELLSVAPYGNLFFGVNISERDKTIQKVCKLVNEYSYRKE